MNRWSGKILRVNLTNMSTKQEKIDPKVAQMYIGGRGFGIYYLSNEVDPLCDPLGEANKLILTTGPLTGTGAPTGSRYMVTTKSPLTGAISCSNSGGYFPSELKRAGFDVVIIEGRSENPVYLWINGEHAQLRAAAHLWGMSTHATDDALRSETDPMAKTAVIGPAGERLVRFASIMNDKDRAAGRSGVGAVMGAKNLKGIAVRGLNTVHVADPAQMKTLSSKYRKLYKDATKNNPSALRLHGTAITCVATQASGVFPTQNFRYGTFDEWEKISGETLTEKYLINPKACASCPIGCGRSTEIPDGPFKGKGEGPEYETVYALGSDCAVSDLAAVTKANYVCNELGMDTISMGSAIACAMELYEIGALKRSDVGFPLRWGDGRGLVELTRNTGLREGFGDLLAEGSLRLATRFGHPELAMVSKGSDFPGYDPRGSQGMGLAYATSPMGASHMRGDTAYFELLGVPLKRDPQVWEGKASGVKRWQDVFAILDAAGVCVFFSVRYLVAPVIDIDPIGITELLNAAMGFDFTVADVERAGERIFNAERLFLNRAGFSRKDDSLPPRMVREPMPKGPAKGLVCHLDAMLKEYYALRGWDQDGRPTEQKLNELGLL